MAVCVIDYFLDELLQGNLPSLPSVVIVCKEICVIKDPAFSNFTYTSDIDRILRGGNFIVRVSNDIQRGLIYFLLASKSQAGCKFFTHRAEVLLKYIGPCQLEVLQIPIRSFIAAPLKSSPEVPQAPKKLVDPFELVYRDSLEKYVSTFLLNSTRANKLKSAKAQLKNLVNGIIISVTKQINAEINFSPDEITEAIFADLESHGVISASGLSVDYYDDWIEIYFGRAKTKPFIPGKRNIDKAGVKKDEPDRKEDDVKEIITALADNCMNDRRISEVEIFGDLVHLCKLILKKHLEEQNKVISTIKQNEVLKGLYRFILLNIFYIESAEKVDRMVAEPQANFTENIKCGKRL